MPTHYARELLARSLNVKSDLDESYTGLSRRAPEDLQALARSQGVQPLQFESLVQANFWPEDEGADEILTTLRG